MKAYLFVVTFVVVSFLLLSCASWQKKPVDKNNLVGAGAQDIVSKDIDSDSQGSDGGGIEGLSTVYFDYDSFTLSEDAQQILRANLQWIQNTDKVLRVELEGHCDTLGSEAYNIGLGRRRAEAVKNFLIKEGLQKTLSVVSYGEEKPLSEVEHSKNRRVNFVPLY